MKCPYCGFQEDKVIDSRSSQEGDTIRRRRECMSCDQRFTTYETIELQSIKVIKKNQNRQEFDRQKLRSGIGKACEKRPISSDQIAEIIRKIEYAISRRPEAEVNSKEIGEMVMNELHNLDEVAYVRFASVYRQFKDVNEFVHEISRILKK